MTNSAALMAGVRSVSLETIRSSFEMESAFLSIVCMRALTSVSTDDNRLSMLIL